MFTKDKSSRLDNKVRAARNHKTLTQDELAVAVNVTRQTIISIEKGNYVPSVLLALKLAAVLDKKVEELFVYEKV